ncbi:FAD-dependent oxidoreductase [Treponema sp.]
MGKARNTGLVELPLGIPLKDIIYGMGGGAGPHKRVRAVQTGGPSGGCVPADELSVGVDYESLAQLGAIMGSGGMVVMDGETCLVDVARYFTAFTAAESCGKCVPCREGLSQMLHILDAVTRGEAEEKDLDELEALALVVRDSSLCGLGQTAANPVLTTLKYFRDEYLEHIREKRCSAGVCESLFTALCQNSCPLNLNIPGYIQLLKENRIEEAYELTLRGNPLPGTLGRICHFHCQMRCRRETLDEAVAQGEIHRYLADAVAKMGRTKAVWARLAAEKLPPTGKKISIVGAGPAGIMASYFLARLGHELTIYDAHPKAGGVLRYGIPAYRLPREVLDGELGLLSKLGVHFQLSTRIGQDLSFESLREKADAVILAIGAVADRPLGIRGEQLNDVHPGYTLLEALNERRAKAPTGKVLIIGGGNVAIDVARTLIRTGAEVTLAYRRGREDLSANEVEVLGAEEEGVSFLFMVAPEEILGDAEGSVRAVRLVRMAAGPIDASGRSSPIKTKDYFELGCTTVVSAVGEHADIGPLGIKGLAVRTSGSVEVDRFSCKSSLPSVWAIGDLVTGPATAAEAMGIALKAVKAIDLALMGQARMARLEKVFTYRHEAPLEPLGTKMHHSRKLSPEDRRNNFNEITQGYSGEQAIAEAERCLRCDVAECASREGR